MKFSLFQSRIWTRDIRFIIGYDIYSLFIRPEFLVKHVLRDEYKIIVDSFSDLFCFKFGILQKPRGRVSKWLILLIIPFHKSMRMCNVKRENIKFYCDSIFFCACNKFLFSICPSYCFKFCFILWKGRKTGARRKRKEVASV